MKMNIILKGFIIVAVGLGLTACSSSCNIFSGNKTCQLLGTAAIILSAPVMIPYANAQKNKEMLKSLEDDEALIEAITTGNNRGDLEKGVLGRISYHTSVEKRIEMRRLASQKLIQYDNPPIQEWNEQELTAMILAYNTQAYQNVGNEKFDAYTIRAWDLYLQHRKAKYDYYSSSHEFSAVGERYYLVVNKLLNENSAPEKALPIFKQCLKDPIWSMASSEGDGNNGHLPCQYALKYYNRIYFKDANANKEVFDEIERQYKENLKKWHQKLKQEGVIA